MLTAAQKADVRLTMASKFRYVDDVDIRVHVEREADERLRLERGELGCDGILMNTAIAAAKNPVLMASAMKKAVEAGREAFLAGRMPKKPYTASPSSPSGGLISTS